VNVLYIGLPRKPTSWLAIGYRDFASALADRLPHRVYDFDRPLSPQFEGVDIVVEAGGSFATSEMIDTAAQHGVQFWQVIGTGMNHVDVGRFRERGIPLANLPGVFSSIALAEHAFLGMLFFAKNYKESQQALHSRVLCEPVSEELCGKTLSVIGFGASGHELARRASAFGVRIMALDVQSPNPASLQGVACNFIGGEEDLDLLLSEADYVSLHVPLNPTTHHLIGRRELSLLKPSAVLINVARSEVVDESALIEVLRRKSIRGAALDVFAKEPVDPQHPLLELENVFATPHIAGVTSGTSRRRAEAAVQTILRMHGGGDPLYLVGDAASMNEAAYGAKG
jgi:D-3-phosphoglycerate dehydrogenase